MHIRRKLAFSSLALLFFSTVALASDVSAKDLLDKGMAAYKSGDTQKAEALYLAAEDRYPSDPRPLYSLAKLYSDAYNRSMEKYDEAVGAFERLLHVLEINPPSVTQRGLLVSYYDYGRLLLKGGDYYLAAEKFNKFLQIYPDYYDAEHVHNALGVALFRSQRYEEAMAAFKTAMDENPDFIEPRVNMRAVYLRLSALEEARVLLRMGLTDEALKSLDHIFMVSGSYLPAHKLRADILKTQGKTQNAWQIYQSIIASDPADPITQGVRLDMADMLIEKGDKTRALELLNENLSIFRDKGNAETRKRVLNLVREQRSPQ